MDGPRQPQPASTPLSRSKQAAKDANQFAMKDQLWRRILPGVGRTLFCVEGGLVGHAMLWIIANGAIMKAKSRGFENLKAVTWLPRLI